MLTHLIQFSPIFRAITNLLEPQHGNAWLVGGTLRDALVGRELHDLDLIVDVPAVAFARQLADALGGSFVLLDAENAVARVVLSEQLYLDFAQMRGATIDDDLALRDFTVNALAVPLLPDGSLGAIHDPLNGQADIVAGIVRLCSSNAFVEDPLRMLRAVRIAAIFGWQLDPDLDQALRHHADLIRRVSLERVRDELMLLLTTPHSAMWLRYLDRAGVLRHVFPETTPMHGETQPIVHFLDVWEHTLEAICALEWLWHELTNSVDSMPPFPPADLDDPFPPAFFAMPEAKRTYPELQARLRWHERIVTHMNATVGGYSHLVLLKLALLFHDIAKPATRQDKPDGSVSFYGHQDLGADQAITIGQRLRLSRAQIDHVQRIIRGHMRPGQLQDQDTTHRAMYRYFRDLGDVGVDTLLHSLADHLATRGHLLSVPHWHHHVTWTDSMLDFIWLQPADQKPAPLLTGHVLMQELGLQPSPLIGQLLEIIHEAHAIGEISTQAEALALARIRLKAEDDRRVPFG